STNRKSEKAGGRILGGFVIKNIFILRFRLSTVKMSEETAAAPATPATATPKKKAKSGATKSKPNPPTHPKVSEMVVKSITTLKERGGSSLQAIKKHISSQYKVDIDRLTPFIKKYLKSAVAAGTLVQTKGKGANGSFKLSASGQKTKEPKKIVKKPKKEGAASPKKAKAPAKKTAKPKEKAEKKKKPAAAKKATAGAKKVAKPKSPKKAKATKPKAPKPKKLKSPKKAAPKKASKK
ncbi:histone H1C-like, partial [Argiope bruennichi]